MIDNNLLSLPEINLFILFWLGFLTILVFWIAYNTYRFMTTFNKLFSTSKQTDWQKILKELLKTLDKQAEEIEDIEKAIKFLDQERKTAFKKIGLVRFNPFSDTGGTQSWALAILSQDKSGFVISSLHSRQNTRWFIKGIDKAKSIDVDLSKEEKEAVRKAS